MCEPFSQLIYILLSVVKSNLNCNLSEHFKVHLDHSKSLRLPTFGFVQFILKTNLLYYFDHLIIAFVLNNS